MLFSEITGFDDIKKVLIRAVQSNHVAHAQLFMGREGSPALALALGYATYINCEDKQPDDACGKCSSCVKFNKLVHPDLHFIFPSATLKDTSKEVQQVEITKRFRAFVQQQPYGNINDWASFFGAENKLPNIGVEDSRNIIKSLSLKSFEADYKIMLMWLPEFMNIQAANAILKILEEPPAKTLFLLVSNKADKLLSTITSRTQIINIRPFEDEELQQHLVKNAYADEVKAGQVARLADGDLNQAIKLSQEVKNDYQLMFVEWMRYCYGRKILDLINSTEAFQQLGREGQKNFFQYGLTMFREALIMSVAGEEMVRLAGDEFEFIKRFSTVLTPERIEIVSHQLNDACAHIERNANPRIVFLDTSLTIIRIFHQTSNAAAKP
jgi:DNA polymerase-3 subunit delta'